MLFVSLLDQGKRIVQVKMGKAPQKGVMSFFISKFVVDDFLSTERDNTGEFARDRVAAYLEELRADVAYSTNLKRVQTLAKNGQYLAAVVFLISAFETAMKDIFFQNNDLWLFMTDHSPDEKLYEKYGTRLSGKENRKFRTIVHLGDEEWGFTDEGYEKLKTWENIKHRTAVFRICKQLGVLEEYLLRLYSNRLSEVGEYEILKQTLEDFGTRGKINFQMIDGTGGIRWSFKKFLGIDFREVEQDLQTVKRATSKRHEIIHGYLGESQMTSAYVNEVEEAVTKVVAYAKNAVLEWSYVL